MNVAAFVLLVLLGAGLLVGMVVATVRDERERRRQRAWTARRRLERLEDWYDDTYRDES